jgi:uncharacterized protein YukJ
MDNVTLNLGEGEDYFTIKYRMLDRGRVGDQCVFYDIDLNFDFRLDRKLLEMPYLLSWFQDWLGLSFDFRYRKLLEVAYQLSWF